LLDIKKRIKTLDNYVVQPFLELERDTRVLILDRQVLGTVKRDVNLKENGQIGVKVTGLSEMTKQEKEIVDKALKVFNFDLAGLDLFTSKTGKVWLGEINFFPNFASYERVTGENVFEKILTMMDKR